MDRPRLEAADDRYARSSTQGWPAPAKGPEAPRVALAAPDHPSVRALLGALMAAGPGAAAGGWRKGERQAQITQRVGLEAIRIRLEAETGEAAWREVTAVSPLMLDVLTALLHQFGQDSVEARLVRASEVLEAKGYRRWGAERQALEEQIGREIVRLGRLGLGEGADPLFETTPLGDDATSFVLRLDPKWKAAWAAAPLRRLDPRILHFDHRLNRGADVLAKKLALYFSLAGAGGGKPFDRSVRQVLKVVGAAHHLAGGGSRGGRLADRFEEAILRLNEKGLFAVSYRGAGSSLAEEDRVKGWVARWLDMQLLVEPRAWAKPA